MVRRGELTEEDTAHHPHRCVLTRAVGVGATVDVDTFGTARRWWTTVCCYAPTGCLTRYRRKKMLAVMGTAEDPTHVVDALVERALSNGGRDNVTVIVSEVCR